ncbi:MAG: amidohydrolase family protein [Gammaproteobacteria bacterium]|nr:amidohydrolase family protein [Gammaproteobacteria bacterium]
MTGRNSICRSISRVLACATCWLAAASPAIAASDETAVLAGWLLTEPGEPPRTRQTLVISDGKIRSIANGYESGAAERTVDLRDYFVLPGLIDAHVHLAHAPDPALLSEAVTDSEADISIRAAHHARIALRAGFTTVVDFGTLGVEGHDRAIYAVRDGVRKGLIDGPRILAVGNPIAATGQGRFTIYRQELDAIVDRSSLCNGAEDCRRAVREQVRRGADIINFFNTGSLLADNPVDQAMTAAEMRAIVETAHALGRRAIADGHHAAGIAAALRAGADVVDSVHLYDDSVFALLGPDQFLQSHIHGVVAAIGDSPESLQDGLWGWLPEPLLTRFYNIKTRPFAVMQAYRAGVRNISYASDAGVYLWGDNARDLVEFVQRGMEPEDALATATTNAARMLGMDDQLGSIAVGKRADLIAVADNPLEDIETMLQVEFVMRDGKVFRAPER